MQCRWRIWRIARRSTSRRRRFASRWSIRSERTRILCRIWVLKRGLVFPVNIHLSSMSLSSISTTLNAPNQQKEPSFSHLLSTFLNRQPQPQFKQNNQPQIKPQSSATSSAESPKTVPLANQITTASQTSHNGIRVNINNFKKRMIDSRVLLSLNKLFKKETHNSLSN